MGPSMLTRNLLNRVRPEPVVRTLELPFVAVFEKIDRSGAIMASYLTNNLRHCIAD